MAYYHSKHSHSAYAPSSRAEDISRLLDPAYSSSRLSPTSSVYVDHSGDFHDPDYRDFPVVNLTKKPRWERNWQINEQDEDEDQFPPKPLSYARRSSSRPRSPTSTPTTTSSTYSPHSQYVSPPTSLDDDDDVLSSVSSPFASDVDLGESKKRCRLSIDSKRRRSDGSTARPVHFFAAPPLSDIVSAGNHPSVHNQNSKEGLSNVKKTGEDQLTPTCSMALRRQWQAIQLRLSLGVFRAKRRIRRKVGV